MRDLKALDYLVMMKNGESNFDFQGGFDTDYYRDIESLMDEASFGALYMCEPIEREGLLYNADDLQYYLDLPNEKPDTVVAVCDSKKYGKRLCFFSNSLYLWRNRFYRGCCV